MTNSRTFINEFEACIEKIIRYLSLCQQSGWGWKNISNSIAIYDN